MNTNSNQSDRWYSACSSISRDGLGSGGSNEDSVDGIKAPCAATFHSNKSVIPSFKHYVRITSSNEHSPIERAARPVGHCADRPPLLRSDHPRTAALSSVDSMTGRLTDSVAPIIPHDNDIITESFIHSINSVFAFKTVAPTTAATSTTTATTATTTMGLTATAPLASIASSNGAPPPPVAAMSPIRVNRTAPKLALPQSFTFSSAHITKAHSTPLLHSWDYATPHRPYVAEAAVCSVSQLRRHLADTHMAPSPKAVGAVPDATDRLRSLTISIDEDDDSAAMDTDVPMARHSPATDIDTDAECAANNSSPEGVASRTLPPAHRPLSKTVSSLPYSHQSSSRSLPPGATDAVTGNRRRIERSHLATISLPLSQSVVEQLCYLANNAASGTMLSISLPALLTSASPLTGPHHLDTDAPLCSTTSITSSSTTANHLHRSPSIGWHTSTNSKGVTRTYYYSTRKEQQPIHTRTATATTTASGASSLRPHPPSHLPPAMPPQQHTHYTPSASTQTANQSLPPLVRLNSNQSVTASTGGSPPVNRKSTAKSSSRNDNRSSSNSNSNGVLNRLQRFFTRR